MRREVNKEHNRTQVDSSYVALFYSPIDLPLHYPPRGLFIHARRQYLGPQWPCRNARILGIFASAPRAALSFLHKAAFVAAPTDRCRIPRADAGHLMSVLSFPLSLPAYRDKRHNLPTADLAYRLMGRVIGAIGRPTPPFGT